MEQPKVAIITGASSGIGLATAVAFARAGYHVVLAARRQEKLLDAMVQCQNEAVSRGRDIKALAIPTDVSQESQVDVLVARTMDELGRIDVLVNNAGYGLFARVHQTTTEQMRRIFDVNFFGLFYGCKAVVPIMIRQHSGHIFNVSSIIGKRGSPFNGGYSATKFAIVGLTDALRVEMLEHNVRVTAICPGMTDTEFFTVQEGGIGPVKSSFKSVRTLTPPENVARAIVRAVGKNRPGIVFTPGGKLLAFISAFSPRLADRMMKMYYDDLQK
jgi:NAD(P)-dependent dehydrogenase (short-subunit alcohol dehydrogenase family)